MNLEELETELTEAKSIIHAEKVYRENTIKSLKKDVGDALRPIYEDISFDYIPKDMAAMIYQQKLKDIMYILKTKGIEI